MLIVGTHASGVFIFLLQARGLRTVRSGPQHSPTSRLIHAVDRFSAPTTALNRSTGSLAQRRQQRAQARKAVGGEQTTKDQFTQSFFNHARQKVRAGNDIDEE